MIERRKFIRIPQASEISYEIAGDPKTKSFLTKNVSQNGICFFVHEFIPVGTILKVRFSLKTFSYEGFVKVVWCMEDTRDDRFEVGAGFINIPKK